MSMYMNSDEEKKFYKRVIETVLFNSKDFPLKRSVSRLDYDCFTILLAFNSNGKPYASFTHQDKLDNTTRILNSITVTFNIEFDGKIEVDEVQITPKANMSAFNVFFQDLNKSMIEDRALKIKKPFMSKLKKFFSIN